MTGRKERIELIRKIQESRGSKLIVYFTGDRRPFASQIAEDAVLPVVLQWRLQNKKVVRKMSKTAIRYISDEKVNLTDVIIPVELWREIESERETAYLLKSETMKQRLLKAKKRQEGVPFDEACKKLGI